MFFWSKNLMGLRQFGQIEGGEVFSMTTNSANCVLMVKTKRIFREASVACATVEQNFGYNR
jgi:hypothetical protein